MYAEVCAQRLAACHAWPPRIIRSTSPAAAHLLSSRACCSLRRLKSDQGAAHHLDLLQRKAALLIEGAVPLRAVQDDLVAPGLLCRGNQLLNDPAPRLGSVAVFQWRRRTALRETGVKKGSITSVQGDGLGRPHPPQRPLCAQPAPAHACGLTSSYEHADGGRMPPDTE